MKRISKPDNDIKAVHEDKFQLFLKNIGVYDSVISGAEKCKFCGCKITYENIASVFPEGGAIKFVCDSPECGCLMNNYFNEKK